jgi:hypothetical protein
LRYYYEKFYFPTSNIIFNGTQVSKNEFQSFYARAKMEFSGEKRNIGGENFSAIYHANVLKI